MKSKKEKKLKQVRKSCRKFAIQLKITYFQGAHHTILATGTLIPSYANVYTNIRLGWDLRAHWTKEF
jgi:hypothetical protein